MKITGKVVAVMIPRQGISKSTGNEWMTQEYVIETLDQYPRRIVFEVFGKDRIQEFNIQYNELIDVHIDISAQQWQQRWYNTIRAWKVERYANQQQPMQQQYTQQQQQCTQQQQQYTQQQQYVQQPMQQQQVAQQPAPQPVQQNMYGDMPF